MPRVSIKKQKYMETDLRNFIDSKMHRKRLTQADLGEKLGISQPAFSKRYNKSFFTYMQLAIIFKELEATDEEILKIMKG